MATAKAIAEATAYGNQSPCMYRSERRVCAQRMVGQDRRARCPAHELRLGDVNGGAQLANKLTAVDSHCEAEQK